MMYQHYTFEYIFDMAQFYTILFQEVATGGNIKEKVLHRQRRARRASRRLLGDDMRAFNLHHGAQLAIVQPCAQFHLGYCGYRGQRLAAEAHCMDGEEVVRTVYLAGSVALEAEPGVAIAHAAAVIDHLDKGASSILHDEVDLGCTGIHCVLQQFFDGTGWTVDHLAGGDLVGNAVRQYVYDIHLFVSFFVAVEEREYRVDGDDLVHDNVALLVEDDHRRSPMHVVSLLIINIHVGPADIDKR